MLEIAIDIGGTSCDVALVREGKPLLSREGRIARYPLRVPNPSHSLRHYGH